MKANRVLMFVSVLLWVCTAALWADESYEEMDFKKLKKADILITGKTVMIQAGLGEFDSGEFILDDKGFISDKYTAVKLYRPGETKENFNAYIEKGSSAYEMYESYGIGDRLKRTCEKDQGVKVWGTLYYIGGKNYPIAMVLDNVQSNRAAPKGNLRYTITVSSFENKANWAGQWNVGDGFTEIMTNALQESGWFIVLGDKEMRSEAMDEQDLAESGRTAKGKKTPQRGRMTLAQLLVKGAVTHVQNTTTGGAGGINIQGLQLGGAKDHAEINITIYLVDSETGQVKASRSIIGKSERKAAGIGYFGRGLGGVTGGVAGHKVDNVGKACEDAVAQGLDFIIKQLDKIPWEGTIVMAKDDKIIINRGEREGVSVGQRFSVGSVEELIDEDTGEVLDSEMTQVAIIEVTSVREKIAYCTAIEGGEQIEKGMSVHLAD
ncbi:MAG: CsgG/HfaB family protein [Phycisphaerae bacterium]